MVLATSSFPISVWGAYVNFHGFSRDTRAGVVIAFFLRYVKALMQVRCVDYSFAVTDRLSFATQINGHRKRRVTDTKSSNSARTAANSALSRTTSASALVERVAADLRGLTATE
jgi:hypothetical protein